MCSRRSASDIPLIERLRRFKIGEFARITESSGDVTGNEVTVEIGELVDGDELANIFVRVLEEEGVDTFVGEAGADAEFTVMGDHALCFRQHGVSQVVVRTGDHRIVEVSDWRSVDTPTSNLPMSSATVSSDNAGETMTGPVKRRFPRRRQIAVTSSTRMFSRTPEGVKLVVGMLSAGTVLPAGARPAADRLQNHAQLFS